MTARFLIAIPLLVLVYALTLASFAPWDLAIGAVFGTVVLAIFRPFLFAEMTDGENVATDRRGGPPLLDRIVAVVPFAGAILRDIVRGTWTMALIVLHLRPLAHPGIVAIPIGDRTPLGVVVFGLAIGLSPGTVLVDVDWSAGVMLIHVIDAGDPDAVRAEMERFYRRWQRPVAP